MIKPPTKSDDAAAYRECLKRAQQLGKPTLHDLIDDYERMKAG